MAFRLSDKQKISAAIVISLVFFVAELGGISQGYPMASGSWSLTISSRF
jgi:hypothetical protein